MEETFGLSELSLAMLWAGQYPPGQGDDLYLFWQTMYDFIREAGATDIEADAVLIVIDEDLQSSINEANGIASFPLLYTFQVKLLTRWAPHDSVWRDCLTFDQIIQISSFLLHMRLVMDQVRSYSFPELKFTQPLDPDAPESYALDVDAVVQVSLPPDPADFLTWEFSGRGLRLHLNFDAITLDDATGLAIVDPRNQGDGRVALPVRRQHRRLHPPRPAHHGHRGRRARPEGRPRARPVPHVP